ncbi:hypothetical protein BD779DRAFT_1475818 [Infundibulicybe gibba]|nr:hypothetical protein BD779DRAFT_1475818 [Infundibulicybe gibba]
MHALYSIRAYKPDPESRETIRQGVVGVVAAERRRFPRSSGMRVMSWLVMGPLHSSQSDSETHWTIRGVTSDGSVISTIHLYPKGTPKLFRNGGRWEKFGMRLNVRWRGTPL